ncbi:MAG: class I SAM-dependent methyltransferase [Acidimicrobiia bacterium]
MGSAEVQGELWGRAADDWASLQEAQHAPFFEAMLDAAGVSDGVKVLDAGCGGGGASVLAQDRNARVSGLDASASLIDVARHRVPEGDFRVGDLEALPFVDGSFDAVIAANSIQYAEDRIAALRELARVSAPGARIAIGLFGTSDRVDFRVVFDAFRASMPEPPLGDGPFGLSGEGVLKGLVEQAGLSVVESGEVDLPFVYEDTEEFWRGVISGGPPQAAKDKVGEDTLKAATLDAITPYITDTGGVRLENNVFQYITAVLDS